LHYEFEGSLLCYLLCRLFPDRRRRVMASVVLLLGCGLAERLLPLHLFMAGALLHDAPRLIAWRPSRWAGNAAGLLLILGGVVLPRLLAILPGTVAWPFLLRAWLAGALPFWRGDRFATAAVLTVAGLCLAPLLQGLLAGRVFRFLGAISFPLYLTHLPILFSAACFAFLWLAGRMAETPAALLTLAIGGALSLAVATLAARLVERPSLAAARRAGSWLDGLWRRRIGPAAKGPAAKSS
jgi:peptidoglycan/LPS O-acetylase OafA/YrhL